MTTIKHTRHAQPKTPAKAAPKGGPLKKDGTQAGGGIPSGKGSTGARPPRNPKPAAPAKPTPGLALMPRRIDFGNLQLPAMARDNTRVALPTFQENRARSQAFTRPGGIDVRSLPAPRQTYLSQAPNTTPAQRRAAEARFRAQENVNHMAQLDPFAARVNGYFNMGTDRRPNWQQVSPSPLELVATNAGLGGKIVGVVLTGNHLKHAVEHPSVWTIGEATVSVLGTVAGVKHPHGNGLMARTLRGSHTVHQGSQLIETSGLRRSISNTGR